MDPVSAVSVAAAAVQFLTFGLQATALCLQIRDSATSATEHNEEVENLIKEAKASRAALSNSKTSATEVPRRIQALGAKCAKQADELLQLLEHVRGAGKKVGTATKVFRAMKEKRTIEKLQNALRENEKALQSLVISDIGRRLGLQSIEKSAQFASLQTMVQGITIELSKQQAAAQQHTAQLQMDIRSGNAEITTQLSTQQSIIKAGKAELLRDIKSARISITKRITESSLATASRLDDAQKAAEQRHEETEARVQEDHERSRQEEIWQRVLDSLFFPEMHERRSEIKHPAPETFKWIFKPNGPRSPRPESDDFDDDDGDGDDSGSSYDYQWDDFWDWLCRESTPYWICGKLGSGKSTLMAYIVGHGQTKSGLEQWSQGHPLHILSFFFWRPGTGLQKSTVGLLRSLLYQVLIAEPHLVVPVFSRASIDLMRIPAWTERNLVKVITIALGAINSRYCMFIDGLDEFVGSYSDLLDLLLHMQCMEHVKLCVSSRPEVELAARLAHCRHLRLQDLNYPDIHRFVTEKLTAPGIHVRLPRLLGDPSKFIALQAEGVFLWAVLVTQAMVEGAWKADDEETLWCRLQKTPGDIEELFATLIGAIDELHQESLAFYLKAAEILTDTDGLYSLNSILVLTAARLPHEPISSDSFSARCKDTEVQIVAQSAGLLEIHDGYHTPYEAVGGGKAHYCISVDPGDEPRTAWRSGLPVRRELLNHTMPEPAILRYERRYPRWVHRSAQGFVLNAAGSGKLGPALLSSSEDVLRRAVDASLALIATGPSFTKRHHDSHSVMRLRRTLATLVRFFNEHPSLATEKTDLLHELIIQMDPMEFRNSHLLHAELNMEEMFWATCCSNAHWGYISSRACAVPPWLAMLVAYHAVVHWLFLKYDAALMFPKDSRGGYSIFSPAANLKHPFAHSYLMLSGRSSATTVCYKATATRPLQERDFGIELMNAAHLGDIVLPPWSPVIRYYDREANDQRDELCNQLARLSSVIDFHLEIASWGGLLRGGDWPNNRLTLQLSAVLLFHQDTSLSRKPLARPQDGPGLRLICCPWRHRHEGYYYVLQPWVRPVERFFLVDLPQPASTSMLQCLRIVPAQVRSRGRLMQLHASPEYLDRFCQMVLGSVRANAQGLSASDQLFAITCVKLYLRPLLESIRDVPKQKRDEEVWDS